MPNPLDWFVDRVKQHDGFLKMISRATEKQIMLIEAPKEMGKTWLIQVMRHECRTRNLAVAHFDFRDHRAWDYLALVRHARDQFNPVDFNEMTHLINNSTTLTIELASSGSGVQIQGDVNTGGGDFVGRDVIKDNFFFVQADSPTIRQTIEARITDAFLSTIKAMAQRQSVIFLFDSYEEVTAEANQWLCAVFLARIRDNLLPNVIAVLAGRKAPEFNEAWRACTARTDLAPFEREHVEQYFQRRGLIDLDIDTMMRTTRGNPGLLATLADNALLKTADDKDWL